MAAAESAYVAERLRLPLRAEPLPEAAVVKMVQSGEKLEVIERQENYAHVRDAEGNEGWVDARWLAAQPGAAAQLSAVRAELARVKQQLAEAQARPALAADAQGQEVTQLQTELAAVRAQLVELQSTAGTAPAGGAAAPTSAAGGGFSWIWLGISFAMLMLGFIVGIVWVRESIRRRMGGLYLRI